MGSLTDKSIVTKHLQVPVFPTQWVACPDTVLDSVLPKFLNILVNQIG